ncbi:MAG: hypothetical protein EXX96DRAFT_587088 [Benjaminiella poitrasii]|nr:MAG: hypothetical protein EXX96DRAFT_587088 [Benjaminiella poitrasii]
MKFISVILVLFAFIANEVYQVSAQAVTNTIAPAPSNTGTVPVVSATTTAIMNTALPAPTAAVGNQTVISNTNQTAATLSNGAQNNNSLAGLPTSASFGNTVYPGGASFIKPTPSKSVSPLYRIDSKENVTFIWTYTDLLVAPVNLTLAAVAPNKVTYTISALSGLATSAVWQIKDVPTASPLMMGMYQVQLYDQRGVSANIQPGWLAPNTRLTIAFYSPESYQASSGSDYCPTCFYNAGMRMAESLGPILVALGVASATSVMILYGLLY